MPDTTEPVVLLAHVPNSSAGSAFEAALRQASLRGARLEIVNASKGESLVDSQQAKSDDLEELVAQAAREGVAATVTRPIGPDVATLILNRASELTAELIVLGTRHRSSVGKLLLGSTAQRVLMEADCEVLLVKGPRP